MNIPRSPANIISDALWAAILTYMFETYFELYEWI